MWFDVLSPLFTIVCHLILRRNMVLGREMVFYFSCSCIHICKCNLDGASPNCIKWNFIGCLSFHLKNGFLKDEIYIDHPKLLANCFVDVLSHICWGKWQLLIIAGNAIFRNFISFYHKRFTNFDLNYFYISRNLLSLATIALEENVTWSKLEKTQF